MIPNGKEMTWHGHHLVFESEPDQCRGCFFEDKDSCPDCDMGAWVEQKSYHCPSIEIHHNNWCTGTPTEDGTFLVYYWDDYNPLGVTYEAMCDVMVQPVFDDDGELECWVNDDRGLRFEVDDIIRWQKIEPYKEKEDVYKG